ncbi:AraC family transcriptional regulator [Diaphorobacter aerolatus]|uniref:AraC family transcriptional regulator n=1 Tax=Diaphorobacter aerolatus TaxID=1288495 RepID=A0A7H0GH62_9BURK|nr:AraC family transcriptional regulator [Diaphorobacter aerolatus]QNP47628.1 AraC family transcriptional regulator [Diaphorobacter aerolatus]
MDTLVRTVTLNGFLNVCNMHGVNSHALLKQVGLDASTLVDSERHISAETLCKLLDLAAAQSHCAAFGIQMAQHRQTLDFGIMGVLMRHKPTLRDMWLAAIQYRKLLNDATAISLEQSGELSILRFELLIDSQIPQQQSCELVAGVMMRTCQAVLGGAWSPREVRFMHAAPQEQYQHKQFFGCPVTFNSEFNGIVLRTLDMAMPNPAADPELVRYAESIVMPMRALGDNALLQEVRKNIYLLMPLEQACIERVAEQMHLSTRTLQRQLDQSGTSFSEVLDTVRKNLVLRYMNNSRYSIGQVASLTGYSRQASFTRWFQANFGTSPRQWRQTRLA